MKKISSLFQRNYDTDGRVRDEIVPGAEWVAAGEGVATIKFDGTCCLARGGKLFRRYDAKHGKTPRIDFEPAQDIDPVTGHWPGWVPVGEGPNDQWHREALASHGPIADGTYELCGPKIGENPEGFDTHQFIRHGLAEVDAPRTFDALKEWLRDKNIEGLVWRHPDGRMVKIKKKDFGLKREGGVVNLHILQHSRGLDEYGRGTWYRNHFCAGGKDLVECQALVAAGLMICHRPSELSGGDPTFSVTAAGDAYIREHSSKPPKVSRGRARYRQWLKIADAVGPFGEWLKRGGKSA